MQIIVQAETARTLKDRIVGRIMQVLEGMPPGEVLIEIVRLRRRTTRMNRLYWMWLGILASDPKMGGYSKSALHEVMMHRAGFHDVVELAGQTTVVRWSSTKLSVDQFCALMQEVEEVALFLEIELPYPETIGEVRAAMEAQEKSV